MRIVEREERVVRHNAQVAFTGRLYPDTGPAYGRVVIGPRYRFVRETDRHGNVTVTAESIKFNAATFEYDAKLLHRWEG